MKNNGRENNSKMKKLFIISGEKSGDLIANGIIQEAKKLNPNIEICGIGGDSFSKNGLKSLFDQKELSIMGFLEILPKIKKMLQLIKLTVKAIENFKPDHIITVDSPGFCFRVVKKLRKINGNWKIHHIVAPSVWAYKKNRAKKVAKLYNTLFCILPFEPPYFEKYGLKTIFIGYAPFFRMREISQNLQQPLGHTSILHPQNEGIPSACLSKNITKISITLGSRITELKHHIPIIKKTIAILNKKFPKKLNFVIIALPHLKSLIHKEFESFLNVEISNEEDKWQNVVSSKFVIAKSGTNVMEFALLGVPSVVYYKANFLTAWIIKFLIYNKVGTLLNFTAGRFILPEFIQERAGNLYTKAIEWIESDEEVEKVRMEMKKELEKFASNDKPEEIVLRNLD